MGKIAKTVVLQSRTAVFVSVEPAFLFAFTFSFKEL